MSRYTPGRCDQENARDIKLCDLKRLKNGLLYAERLGATHGILTSRADPTQEKPEHLLDVIRLVREHMPMCDMHTNGFLLLPGKPKENLLREMAETGLNMITFSIASFQMQTNQNLMVLKQSGAELVPIARDLGILVRCSLVVNKQNAHDFNNVIGYIKAAGELGAHMVVIREVWVPDVYGDFNKDVYEWNIQNKVDIKLIQDKFIEIAKNQNNKFGLRQLRQLPWGTPVFGVEGIFTDKTHGVNVTFARCDEANVGDVMKSIVHKVDGHGYRNWDFNADILY